MDRLNVTPLTRAFVIGMFLGAAYGMIFCICEVYGRGGPVG